MAKKVLLVEDSADISFSLKLLIELRGYVAIVASTGREGCRLALAERPDLILMDLSLPDISGMEAVQEIRTHPENAATPIVCVSSYTEGKESQIIEAGCDEVLSKTAFMNSFEKTLEKYLKD